MLSVVVSRPRTLHVSALNADTDHVITVQHAPPGASNPSRLSRWVRWVVRGATAILPAVLVALFFTILALGGGLIDLRKRDAARDLDASGRWATVTDVEVYVFMNRNKGGDYYETADVRVRLPGVNAPVALKEVRTPDEYERRKSPEGWQAPTERTGYQPPLEVRYRIERDGSVVAMARQDLNRVANSREPLNGLIVGLCTLALLGAAVAAGNHPAVRRLVQASND